VATEHHEFAAFESQLARKVHPFNECEAISNSYLIALAYDHDRALQSKK
jgi:hypothetical protein